MRVLTILLMFSPLASAGEWMTIKLAPRPIDVDWYLHGIIQHLPLTANILTLDRHLALDLTDLPEDTADQIQTELERARLGGRSLSGFALADAGFRITYMRNYPSAEPVGRAKPRLKVVGGTAASSCTDLFD